MHADMLQYNTDVTIISEIQFNEKIDSNIVSLDGYNSFRRDIIKIRGYAEVYASIKDSITCEIIWSIVDSHPSIEIIVLKRKFRSSHFNIACYHPSRPLFSVDHLNEVIDSIFNPTYKNDEDSAITVFAGDLNALDWNILCDEYGLFTNRPDLYNNCFPTKSTVTTKPFAVIAQYGFDKHKSILSRRKTQLTDIRTHNID
jgi:hypothetical protein